MTSRPSAESRGWRVGRIGGAPVVITPGWALIAVVLVVTFGPWLDRQLDLGVEAYLWAFTVPLMLLVSVLAHELAHGLAARRLGVPVGEYVITLWGGHTSFRGGVGTPGASALIAVAGPAANVVLAVAAWAASSATDGLAALALAAVTYANGFVAVFNLLPALPLDGGKLLEALVWKTGGERLRGTIVAGRAGQVLAVTVVGVALGGPLLRGERPSIVTAIWALLLGAVLWSGAQGAVQQARAQRSARAMDLLDLASGAHVLAVEATVADLDRALQAAPSAAVVLVDVRGVPVALVDDAALAAVPASGRDAVAVTAVARRLPRTALVTEHRGAPAVAQVARAAQAGSAVVVLVRPGSPRAEVLGVVPVSAVARSLAPRAAA